MVRHEVAGHGNVRSPSAMIVPMRPRGAESKRVVRRDEVIRVLILAETCRFTAGSGGTLTWPAPRSATRWRSMPSAA